MRFSALWRKSFSPRRKIAVPQTRSLERDLFRVLPLCKKGLITTGNSTSHPPVTGMSIASHHTAKVCRRSRPSRRCRSALWRNADTLCLSLELDLEKIIPAGQALKVAVSAVVNTVNDGLIYWALVHPGLQPDFHRKESFIFEL